MPILVRFVQRFDAAKRHEFMDLEKLFVDLERKGILPSGERMSPISSRNPGNTLIWEGRFQDLAAAGEFLRLIETNPEHTELFDRQKVLFKDSWIEFYEILNL